MATPEAVAAAFENLNARLAALEQEAQTLRAEATTARQEAAVARQELQTVQAQAAAAAVQQAVPSTSTTGPSPSDAVLHQLASLPALVAQAVAEATTKHGKPPRQLTDPRGLGKPPFFDGKEAEFTMWAKKAENYIVSVYPEARILLRIASESLVDVDLDLMKADPEVLAATPDDEIIEEVNSQVHSALMALTSNEPFTITLGSGAGNGLEAWRRLHKRFDPSTAGESLTLRRTVQAVL